MASSPGPARVVPAAVAPSAEQDAGLVRVVSSAAWPAPGLPDPEPLPGFVESSFSPLVADVAERCLRGYLGAPPLAEPVGARVALLLSSVGGDLSVARVIADSVDHRGRVSPLMFFQSVANAVLGHLAARWGITGPLLCVSPTTDPATDGAELARAVLEADEADAVLVVHIEQAGTGYPHDRARADLHLATGREHPRTEAGGQ